MIQYPQATHYIETDMMEWKENTKAVSLNKSLQFNPFEIKTVKLL